MTGFVRRWIARLKGLLAPGRQDAEALDEMAFHIEMETRDGIARGLSREEARRAALRDFGGIERYREQAREARWSVHIHNVLRDAQVGVRGLVARPGYTAVVLLTLALGIGATTALFTLVHGVLLRPLPYEDPEQLYRIGGAWDGSPQGALSPAEFVDLEEQLTDFRAVGAYAFGSLTFTGGGQAERARAAFVSTGALEALGVDPAVGRLYSREEDRGNGDVVLITDAFWRSRFGGDPDIVGRTVQVNGIAAEVVGVMPPHFRIPEDLTSPEPVQVVAPLGIDPASQDRTQRGSHFLEGVGRIGPGMRGSDAVERVVAAGRRMVEVYPDEYPEGMNFRTRAAPLLDDLVGPARSTLLLLMGAVGLALSIVWANVANLQLSRVSSRSGELALRRALGATRSRIVNQVLVESLVLALAGGALGIVIAVGVTDVLVRMVPVDLPRIDDIAVSGPVLAFGLATALISGLLFGVGPAFYASRGEVTSRLGSGDRDTSAGRGGGLRRWLVTSQVAVAVVLAASAALVARSLVALGNVDPGFRTDDVVSVRVTLPSARYPEDEDVTDFFAAFVAELETIPGVTGAGAVTNLPLATRLGDMSFELEEALVPEGRDKPDADWQVVTPGYFETLQLRLLAGRAVEAGDRPETPGVVVINRTMAELHWPGQDPLGRRIRLGGQLTEPRWAQVIGIVDDVRHMGLDVPARPQMYFAHAQFRFWSNGAPSRTLTAVAHSTLPAAELGGIIRSRLANRDPELALYGLTTLSEARSRSLGRQRFTGTLLAGFSGLALTLALIGVYGVMMYTVRRQIREFGIRIALGAAPDSVVRRVLAGAARMVALGVLVGLVATVALSAVLRSFLFEVSPTDPLSLSLTVAAVAAAGLLASWIPARLAAGADPVTALRTD